MKIDRRETRGEQYESHDEKLEDWEEPYEPPAWFPLVLIMSFGLVAWCAFKLMWRLLGTA